MPMDKDANTNTRTAARSILPGIFITTMIAILLGVFEEMADPFGLDTHTDLISANIYNSITSPLYGQRTSVKIDGQSYSSHRGQANVITLLIDDHYLETSEQSWPISPDKYRRILRKLANAGSSAVFIDIYFSQNSPEKQQQVARLFNYANRLQRNSDTAMIFAGTLQDPLPSAAGTAAPGAALAQMFNDFNFYPLTQQASDGEQYDTAAWSLYKAWCQRNSQQCATDKLADFPVDDIYLHWGFTANRMMTEIPELQGSGCKQQADSLGSALWQSMKILGWNFLKGFQDNRMAPCPYQSQIKLGLFNNLSADELSQLVQNRIVIIGTALSLYPDYHLSPVQGYIPGAFWHAMAMDNLIEFSRDYMKSASGSASDYAEPAGILVMLLVQALLSYVIRKQEFNQSVSQYGLLKLELYHGLFTICLVSATVLAVTGYMRWSPANWVGLAMLMFLIDLNPITALPKYCWQKLPIRSNVAPRLALLLNGVKAMSFSLALVLVCYLLFIFPHALLLSRDYNDTVVCYAFMALYLIIATICLLRILVPPAPPPALAATKINAKDTASIHD